MKKGEQESLFKIYFISFISAIFLIFITYQGMVSGYVSFDSDLAVELPALDSVTSGGGSGDLNSGDGGSGSGEGNGDKDGDDGFWDIGDIGDIYERPLEPCICPLGISLVCGKDGKVYKNWCYAACEGVKVAYPISVRDLNALNPDRCDPNKNPNAIPGIEKFRESISSETSISSSDSPETNLRISKGKITLNQEEYEIIDEQIEVNIGGSEVLIEVNREEITILAMGGIKAIVEETAIITIQNNIVKIGQSEIKLSPLDVVEIMEGKRGDVFVGLPTGDEVIYTVIEKDGSTSNQVAELREEAGEAKYRVTVMEQRRLFGFIPIKIKNTYDINAETGQVSETIKSFLWWFIPK